MSEGWFQIVPRRVALPLSNPTIFSSACSILPSAMSKLAAALFVGLILLPQLTASASAETLRYRIEREWVILEVNSDGSITLTYNITVAVDEGAIRRFFRVGMPAPGFEVVHAEELETGAEPDFDEIEEGDYYAVEFHPTVPILAGESRTYVFTVIVPKFIYKDETNPGNVGLLFIPSWFDDAPVEDLRVMVVLPEGVEPEEVRNTPDYDNLLTVDGRLALYWERRNLAPGEKFSVGVSFPSQYVEKFVEQPPSQPSPLYRIGQILGVLVVLFPFFLVVGIIAYAYVKRTRSLLWEYETPWIGIEALGAQDRLNPPEAAYLLLMERGEKDFARVVTVALIEALKLGIVEVEGLDPLRLKVVKKQGPWKYYLRRLVSCVGDDGRLKEDCLASLIKAVHRATWRKLSGFSRKETVEHYRKLIADAWRELREAPPEKKREVLDKWIEWLMIDERFHKKLREALRTAPRPTKVVLPRDWWMYRIWYWTWPDWRVTVAIPRAEPKAEAPPTPVTEVERRAEGPVVTLERAADEVARGVESVFESVAESAEGLADKVAKLITPEQPRPRSRVRVSSCVCACVSCACACACVSCACACAGGGAG